MFEMFILLKNCDLNYKINDIILLKRYILGYSVILKLVNSYSEDN